MTAKKKDIRPPNDPWIELKGSDDEGVLAYYISDSSTKIPIRDITHENDPKADPNLETMTFGLFSYCHEAMRKKMINDGVNLLFFVTKRRKETEENGNKKLVGLRVLTGYYRVGWYYEIKEGDYALAARKIKFVYPGYPLEELTEYLGESVNTGFMQKKFIHRNTPKKLLQLIEKTPDSTEQYIKEIHEKEQEALEKWGNMYRERKQEFTWKDAEKFIK